MKAMICKTQASIATSPLEWTNVAEPQVGPGEVRVRVRVCAICRTDLHVIEGDLEPRKRPIVPGHQVIGIVDQVGTGCHRFSCGSRIGIAWLRHTCGHCQFCLSGRENLCSESAYTGWTADGGYAEYAVVHEDFAYPIPEQFSDLEASALLCSGIIGYRALSRSQLPPGGSLAIYGFGSSAHVVAQIAKGRGSRIFVCTRGKRHQDLARQLGADWVGDAYDRPPKLCDSSIIFAPVGELVPVALAALARGGTLALAGIVMSDIPTLNYERHLFYEKNVHSVTSNTREDGKGLLREAATLGIKPRVTRYRLEDANRALSDLKADKISGTGVLEI